MNALVPVIHARIVSGDAMRALTQPAQYDRPWIEARLRDAANTPGAVIVWTAVTGQPTGDTVRLSWCPGTPLPDRTLYVTATTVK